MSDWFKENSVVAGVISEDFSGKTVLYSPQYQLVPNMQWSFYFNGVPFMEDSPKIRIRSSVAWCIYHLKNNLDATGASFNFDPLVQPTTDSNSKKMNRTERMLNFKSKHQLKLKALGALGGSGSGFSDQNAPLITPTDDVVHAGYLNLNGYDDTQCVEASHITNLEKNLEPIELRRGDSLILFTQAKVNEDDIRNLILSKYPRMRSTTEEYSKIYKQTMENLNGDYGYVSGMFSYSSNNIYSGQMG